MGIGRRLLFIACSFLLVAAVAPRLGPGPKAARRLIAPPSAAVAAAQTTVPVAQPAAPPANTPQAYTLPPDKLAKAIALSRIRHILDLAGSLWGLAVLWILLATGAAAGLGAWCERLLNRRWLSGMLFFAAFIAITTLASLPLEWYGHHVERAYGISVQGWASWLGDEGKGLGLSILFGVPILLFFNWIVRRWPRRYWLGVWLATLPILVLAIFVSPLLEPIFNKFEPLNKNNPALVAELEKVVARTGTDIPPERMFLMKASLKTNGLNAYVSGIGATKRVVVWDTTAGRIPNDQVLFIFGHESGHYVLHHIPKELAGSAVFLFSFIGLVPGLLPGWQGALGRAGGPRNSAAAPGLWFCCSPFPPPASCCNRSAMLLAVTLSTRPMSMGRKQFTGSFPTRKRRR